MVIPVFKREIEAGIAEQIQKDNTIAMIVGCKAGPRIEDSISKSAFNSVAGTFFDNFDLYPFESVLVSTGWNANDDVFVKEEVWKAKSSPLHKKINYMHDETDIIGHMISSRALDRDSQNIPFDLNLNDVPNTFDLVSGGYLYSVWDNPELQERMTRLIAGMEAGEWFVSMECLFPNFDYGIMSSTGEQYIIPRTQETASLSKHLRRYGGKGQYGDYKIGRVLRDITFSGKGIVDNPANKRSVILNTADYTEFLGAAASLDILRKIENNKENRENVMSDTVAKEKYDALLDEVKTLKAEAKLFAEKEAKAQIDSAVASANSANTKVVKLETDLAASKEVTKAHEDKVKVLEGDLKVANEKLTKANEDLAKVAQENLKAKRLAMFADKDITPVKAEELVTKFIGVSDEFFAELVTAMPIKKVEDKTVADKKKETVEDALAKAEIDKTVVTVPVEDKTKETRANAAVWLTSCLSNKAKVKTENKGDK